MSSHPAPANEPILLRQEREGIATLTLNRPQARNALSMALMGDLLTAFGVGYRFAAPRP